ncbi:hypothetical protein ACK3F5_09290 [Photorhabdus asymbiotica UENP]
MTGVSEYSQQRGNLKDDGYKLYSCIVSRKPLKNIKTTAEPKYFCSA